MDKYRNKKIESTTIPCQNCGKRHATWDYFGFHICSHCKSSETKFIRNLNKKADSETNQSISSKCKDYYTYSPLCQDCSYPDNIKCLKVVVSEKQD